MRVLTRSAAGRADGRAAERLADVEALLGEDLAVLERQLDEALRGGPPLAVATARHLTRRGGKRIRPVALLLSARCFGEPTAAARELALVAELVHSATLLHDDVVDEGRERRGAPTARLTFGNAVSVLSGDLLLVAALERTQAHCPAELPSLVATLRRLVEGEVLQLGGRTELDASRATYQRILEGKTASLFEWCTLVGARSAGAGDEDAERLGAFGAGLGVAFQLVDDLLDYEGQSTGKTLATDLREGKLTLPLVVALEREPALARSLNRIHRGEEEDLAQLVRAVVASGACDEVRRVARATTEAALERLAAVHPSPARELLQRVALELVARTA